MSGTTSTFQLQPPIMGYTMEINSSGDKMAVVGTGKPLKDWSALDTSAPLAFSPNQQRPIYGDGKYRHLRTQGLPVKFARKGNLKEFKCQIQEFIEANGFFAITHVPDPVSGKMLCIVNGHPRFTVQSVTKQVEQQVTCYDKYDKANDAEAKIFLGNSLDPELAAKLYLKVKTTDPFPIMF
ncbi:unnamed protein product [Cylindrotheca closterium]|uniref:Uncharacterized protein n=1 Tax=Cylindrotheca closterium TaxID=2856 RepID=A0AAD2CXK9_9STRA|nr:unnamed protein product [Cylindrotheca closterium]